MHFHTLTLLVLATCSMTQVISIPVAVTTIVTKEDNSTALATFVPPADNTLSYCKGPQAYYDAEDSECFDDAVCKKGTLGCGTACYDPGWYRCLNKVVYGSRGDPLLKNATDVQVHYARMMQQFEMRRR